MIEGQPKKSFLSRKNDLTLRIAVIFSIAAVPYLMIFGYLRMLDIQMLVMATILFFGISILFHKLKFFPLSKAFLVLGPTLTFFGSANVLGPDAGAQYLLFTLVLLPILLFELNQIGWMSVCIVAPVCAYLMLELGAYSWVFHRGMLTVGMLSQIRIFVILSTFLLLILSAVVYFISNRRYELALESQNQALEKANQEIKRKVELDKEIKAARRIQESVLPKLAPDVRGYTIDHYFLPAKQVSGDYYDYFPLSRNKVGILIADIVGKGVPASMMMMTFKSLMHNAIHSKLGPAKTCELLNGRIYLNQVLGKHVPIMYGILDIKAHTFTYCNAGHSPGYLLRNGQAIELSVGGFALGAYETELFEEEIVHLDASDRIVMFTDGAQDIKNNDGERLEIDAVCRIMEETHREPNGVGFVGKMGHELLSYSAGSVLADDITIVSVLREK